jgi:hypothetical protein
VTARGAVMLGIALAFLIAPRSADAQGRFEIGGGLRWAAAISYDAVPANETTSGGGTRALFTTQTDLEAAAGAEARLAVRLWSGLHAEGAFVWATPQLATKVTGDTEGVADTTITESMRSYTFEGGVRGELARWRVGRLAPFASAGAAYVRQEHDGRFLIEDGRLFYAGGGFTYPVSPALGLRADVRADFVSRGVALDDHTHVAPSLAASLFWKF